MRATIKASVAAALSTVILMTGGNVAEAAPAKAIICGADKPARRSDGSWDLNVFMTNAKNYTGRPFSFKLTLVAWSLGGGVSRTWTYVGTPRAYHTPKLPSDYRNAIRLEAWQSGTRCGQWKA